MRIFVNESYWYHSSPKHFWSHNTCDQSISCHYRFGTTSIISLSFYKSLKIETYQMLSLAQIKILWLKQWTISPQSYSSSLISFLKRVYCPICTLAPFPPKLTPGYNHSACHTSLINIFQHIKTKKCNNINKI